MHAVALLGDLLIAFLGVDSRLIKNHTIIEIAKRQTLRIWFFSTRSAPSAHIIILLLDRFGND